VARSAVDRQRADRTNLLAPFSSRYARPVQVANPLGYRPALDGVRGIAVALVVSFHLWDWPRMGGALGVQVFFVLSGFLITTLLLEEHERTGRVGLRAFYVRRALRLFPLLYVALAITAVVVIVAATDVRWYLHSIAAAALYVGNLYGNVARTHNELAPAVGHLWSLAVEEQFYLVWPIVLVAVLRFAPRRLLPLVAIGAAGAIVLRAVLVRAGETVWTLPTTYADALLAGCLIAVLRRHRGEMPALGAVAAVALLASCVVPSVALERGAGLLYLWPTAVGVVLVVAGVADVGWLRQRWLVELGGISYGLYVVHPLFAHALRPFLGDWPTWAAGVVIAVTSVVIAVLSRRTLEAWFLRRKPEPPGRTQLQDLPAPAAG